MTRDRSEHGWWPYLLPYGLFLLLVEIGSRLPDHLQGIWLPLKVAVPALLLIYFWRAGSYPELRGYAPSAGALLSDVAVGVGIAVVWVAPVMLWDVLPRPEPTEGFDSSVYGAGGTAAALAIRGVGFFAVTPFVEELFVRSFLLRFVDVFKSGADFRTVPIARYTRLSFWFTVGWFTFSHATWEYGVAFAAGILFNLWLYRRGHLMAPVVAHVAANAAIWLAVVSGVLPRIFL